ncbi:hypothetical protein [Bifidobacterium sp.]|uniref:hypothetical protein n=1 Tax=Bifidobacterium sp. TaxID=41200 RepID=UPI0039E8D4A0
MNDDALGMLTSLRRSSSLPCQSLQALKRRLRFRDPGLSGGDDGQQLMYVMASQRKTWARRSVCPV